LKEEKADGAVPLSVYIEYFKMGGFCWFTVAFSIFTIAQAIRMITDWWLGMWSEDEFNTTAGFYTLGYALFSVGSAILFYFRYYFFI